MNINEIQQELFCMQDTKYRDFQAKLLPTVNPQYMIGVRTPQLRTFAKTLYKQNDFSDFLNVLPHKYFDENQLHAFLICEIKDFAVCLEQVDKFLPFVDNWATCDQMSPKIFKKHKKPFLENQNLEKWTHNKAIQKALESYRITAEQKKYLRTLKIL